MARYIVLAIVIWYLRLRGDDVHYGYLQVVALMCHAIVRTKRIVANKLHVEIILDVIVVRYA